MYSRNEFHEGYCERALRSEDFSFESRQLGLQLRTAVELCFGKFTILNWRSIPEVTELDRDLALRPQNAERKLDLDISFSQLSSIEQKLKVTQWCENAYGTETTNTVMLLTYTGPAYTTELSLNAGPSFSK